MFQVVGTDLWEQLVFLLRSNFAMSFWSLALREEFNGLKLDLDNEEVDWSDLDNEMYWFDLEKEVLGEDMDESVE